MRAILLGLLLTATPALAADGTRKAGDQTTTQARQGASRGDTSTDGRTRDGRKARDGRKRDGTGKKGRKGVKIDEVSPVHGVLIYGPKLGTHDKYERLTRKSREPVKVKPKDLPDREVNRDGSIAVGLTAGMLNQGYGDGSSNGDLGLGLKGRYRPVEFIGLELGIQRHADGLLGGDRTQTLTSGSVDVFAFPWAKISPYAVAGLTLNGRDIDPALPGSSENLTGAHVGLGVEFTLTENLALDLEGRTYRWLDRDADDPTNPGALQLGGGLILHF